MHISRSCALSHSFSVSVSVALCVCSSLQQNRRSERRTTQQKNVARNTCAKHLFGYMSTKQKTSAIYIGFGCWLLLCLPLSLSLPFFTIRSLVHNACFVELMLFPSVRLSVPTNFFFSNLYGSASYNLLPKPNSRLRTEENIFLTSTYRNFHVHEPINPRPM